MCAIGEYNIFMLKILNINRYHDTVAIVDIASVLTANRFYTSFFKKLNLSF